MLGNYFAQPYFAQGYAAGGTVLLAGSDSGAAVEALSVFATQSISETGSGSEGSSPLLGQQVIEEGTLDELAELIAEIGAVESGAGSELVSLIAGLAVFDLGAASEAAVVDIIGSFLELTGADQGVALETALLSIWKIMTVVESGKGRDLLAALGAELGGTDVASGDDAGISGPMGSDLGSGVDALAQLSGYIATMRVAEREGLRLPDRELEMTPTRRRFVEAIRSMSEAERREAFVLAVRLLELLAGRAMSRLSGREH